MIAQCWGRAAVVMLVLAWTAASRSPAQADVHLLLPNLRPLPASDLQFSTAEVSPGVFHEVIRLSATTWNDGAGPLEIHADTPLVGDSQQHVRQYAYTATGGLEPVPGSGGLVVWHPEHSHFHFESFAAFELQPLSAPGGAIRTGSKTTFCIMDTDRIDHKLDGAPKRAHYTTCGQLVQGMSVGWGDTYRSTLFGQWIDVDDLVGDSKASGLYLLRMISDPNDKLSELNEFDNVAEIEVEIDFVTREITVAGAEKQPPGNGRGRPNR